MIDDLIIDLGDFSGAWSASRVISRGVVFASRAPRRGAEGEMEEVHKWQLLHLLLFFFAGTSCDEAQLALASCAEHAVGRRSRSHLDSCSSARRLVQVCRARRRARRPRSDFGGLALLRISATSSIAKGDNMKALFASVRSSHSPSTGKKQDQRHASNGYSEAHPRHTLDGLGSGVGESPANHAATGAGSTGSLSKKRSSYFFQSKPFNGKGKQKELGIVGTENGSSLSPPSAWRSHAKGADEAAAASSRPAISQRRSLLTLQPLDLNPGAENARAAGRSPQPSPLRPAAAPVSPNNPSPAGIYAPSAYGRPQANPPPPVRSSAAPSAHGHSRPPSVTGPPAPPASAPAAAPERSNASTLAERLNELAVAHGDGLLTDEEYRTLRAGLFDGLNGQDVAVPTDRGIAGVQSASLRGLSRQGSSSRDYPPPVARKSSSASILTGKAGGGTSELT